MKVLSIEFQALRYSERYKGCINIVARANRSRPSANQTHNRGLRFAESTPHGTARQNTCLFGVPGIIIPVESVVKLDKAHAQSRQIEYHAGTSEHPYSHFQSGRNLCRRAHGAISFAPLL